MKIAIFSDNFYPELSGISDSIIQLSIELTKLGHKICIFVPHYSKKNYKISRRPVKELYFNKNINIERFYSLPFPSTTKQARLVFPSIWHWLRVKKFNPDIIHSQLFFGVGLEGLIAAKLLKKPIIGTNHTRINQIINNGFIKNRWIANMFTKYMIWYYNRCDFVTTPAESFLKEMIDLGIKGPSRAIANPVNVEIFNNLKKLNKEKIFLKYKLNQPLITYAGRLANEKNIDVIVKAIKIVKEKFPNINFALAGHGKAEILLKKLVNRLNLNKNIKFLGTLNHHDLADLYRIADGFVIASTSEVQSMTVIQAMASGLPVIGVNHGSIPELIGNNVGLLFKEGDETDLAEKIIKLLSEFNLQTSLSKNGINFSAKFSALNIAKEWEKTYSTVISRNQKFKKK